MEAEKEVADTVSTLGGIWRKLNSQKLTSEDKEAVSHTLHEIIDAPLREAMLTRSPDYSLTSYLESSICKIYQSDIRIYLHDLVRSGNSTRFEVRLPLDKENEFRQSAPVILPAEIKTMNPRELFEWIALNNNYVPYGTGWAKIVPDSKGHLGLKNKEEKLMAKVKLGFKKLDPRAKLPEYAHEGDAGMDVFALEDQNLYLHVPTMVHTGIAAEIPDGYEIQVRPRSGLACKGVTVWNSPGTVDSKYRGEICVILMYIHEKSGNSVLDNGITVGQHYEVKAGDKIAQLVLAPVTFAEPYEVQELSETNRGTGGFGSTGR